jgi:hypothetical protein
MLRFFKKRFHAEKPFAPGSPSFQIVNGCDDLFNAGGMSWRPIRIK